MAGFLNFLLICIVIIYVFRLIIRYLFPFILKRFLLNLQRNFTSQQSQTKNKKEGSIHIDTHSEKKSKYDLDHIGEYVEYEEMKK